MQVPIGGVQRYRPAKKKGPPKAPADVTEAVKSDPITPETEIDENDITSSTKCDNSGEGLTADGVDEQEVTLEDDAVELPGIDCSVSELTRSNECEPLSIPIEDTNSRDTMTPLPLEIVPEDEEDSDEEGDTFDVEGDSGAAAGERHSEDNIHTNDSGRDASSTMDSSPIEPAHDSSLEKTPPSGAEETDTVPSSSSSVVGGVAAMIASKEKRAGKGKGVRRESVAIQHKVLSSKSSSSQKISEYERGVTETRKLEKERMKMLRSAHLQEAESVIAKEERDRENAASWTSVS